MHSSTTTFDPTKDVPKHLQQYLITVTDPQDIYIDRRANSERRLRLLYRRFLNQIQYGCKNVYCDVPTCLSARKRLSAAAVRDFTDVSARALAARCVEEFASRGRDVARPLRRNSRKGKSAPADHGLCWSEPIVPWYTHPDEHVRTEAEQFRQNGHVKAPAKTASTLKGKSRAHPAIDDSHGLTYNNPLPNRHSASADIAGNQPKALSKRIDPASFTQQLYEQPQLKDLQHLAPDTRNLCLDDQHSSEGTDRLGSDVMNVSQDAIHPIVAATVETNLTVNENSKSKTDYVRSGTSFRGDHAITCFRILPPTAVKWLQSMIAEADIAHSREIVAAPDQSSFNYFFEQSLSYVFSDSFRLLDTYRCWNDVSQSISPDDDGEAVLNLVSFQLALSVSKHPYMLVTHLLNALRPGFVVPPWFHSSSNEAVRAHSTFMYNHDAALLILAITRIFFHLDVLSRLSGNSRWLPVPGNLIEQLAPAASNLISFRAALDITAAAQGCAVGRSKFTETMLQALKDESVYDISVSKPIVAANVLVVLMLSVLDLHWDRSTTILRASPVGGALEMLQTLYKSHSQFPDLHEENFVLQWLSSAFDDLEMPYQWFQFKPTPLEVHILQYPFLFPPRTLVIYFRSLNFKIMKLSHENALGHYYHAKSQLLQSPWQVKNVDEVLEKVRPNVTRYFVMTIRRDYLLEDAIGQIWHRERQELTRPLRVKLSQESGEEGLDHGGVQQEVFRLIFADAFDPKYGLFKTDETTHMTWFNPASLEPLYKYEALGILMSLAIYNGVTVPVTMPLAFYRKVLGLKVKTIDHIRDGWPTLAKSFGELLAWDDGDVADIMALTYDFSYEAFDTTVTIDMTKGSVTSLKHHTSNHSNVVGSPSLSVSRSCTSSTDNEAPAVTNANRQSFVKDYIKHLTDATIAAQFAAFLKGLHVLLSPHALSLFPPQTLKLLVEGQPTTTPLSISDWRKITQYDGGYNESHETILWFWDILEHDMTQAQLRSLLAFVTASDRLPVNGWEGITFVIQRNGVDNDGRLPTSSTCYGKFLLPEYRTREILRDRLEWAMGQEWGFWMA